MLSRTRLRSLSGVIAAMAVVHLVYGITFPLMALVLDSQGVSKSMIGLSTIVQAAAALVVAPIAPGLMTRFAPSRIMQVMTVALALLIIIAGLYPNVWFWFPLRLIIGAATALLWIASEILINELALDRAARRLVSGHVQMRVELVCSHVDGAVCDAGVAFEIVEFGDGGVVAGVFAGGGKGEV